VSFAEIEATVMDAAINMELDGLESVGNDTAVVNASVLQLIGGGTIAIASASVGRLNLTFSSAEGGTVTPFVARTALVDSPGVQSGLVQVMPAFPYPISVAGDEGVTFSKGGGRIPLIVEISRAGNVLCKSISPFILTVVSHASPLLSGVFQAPSTFVGSPSLSLTDFAEDGRSYTLILPDIDSTNHSAGILLVQALRVSELDIGGPYPQVDVELDGAGWRIGAGKAFENTTTDSNLGRISPPLAFSFVYLPSDAPDMWIVVMSGNGTVLMSNTAVQAERHGVGRYFIAFECRLAVKGSLVLASPESEAMTAWQRQSSPAGFSVELRSVFTGLYMDAELQLVLFLTPDSNLCASSPCQNGGSCIDEFGTLTCVCAKGFTGPACAENVKGPAYLASVSLLESLDVTNETRTAALTVLEEVNAGQTREAGVFDTGISSTLQSGLSAMYASLEEQLVTGEPPVRIVLPSLAVAAQRVNQSAMNGLRVDMEPGEGGSQEGIQLPNDIVATLLVSDAAESCTLDVSVASMRDASGSALLFDLVLRPSSPSCVYPETLQPDGTVLIEKLSSSLYLVFTTPSAIPLEKLRAAYWDPEAVRAPCVVETGNASLCLGDWVERDLSVLGRSGLDDRSNGIVLDDGAGGGRRSVDFSSGSWRARSRRSEDSAPLRRPEPVLVVATSYRQRTFGMNIDFTLTAPRVSAANFDPSNAPYVWTTFGCIVAFVLLTLLYSWAERRAFDLRTEMLLVSKLPLPAVYSEEEIDLDFGEKGLLSGTVTRWGWLLRSKHAWLAAVLPQGIRRRPLRTIKILGLAAAVSMAIGMNSMFSYADIENADRDTNSWAITVNGYTLHLPLEGIYAFIITFPVSLFLALAFGHYSALLNILQQLEPERFIHESPPLPLLDEVCASWAQSALRNELGNDQVPVETAYETWRQHTMTLRRSRRSSLGGRRSMQPMTGEPWLHNEKRHVSALGEFGFSSPHELEIDNAAADRSNETHNGFFIYKDNPLYNMFEDETGATAFDEHVDTGATSMIFVLGEDDVEEEQTPVPQAIAPSYLDEGDYLTVGPVSVPAKEPAALPAREKVVDAIAGQDADAKATTSGPQLPTIQNDIADLERRMIFWRRVAFGVASLMILGGWMLTLVFMGSVAQSQQERWLVGCLEFVLLSAIITAPLVLLIVAYRRQRRLVLFRRKKGEAEWRQYSEEVRARARKPLLAMTIASIQMEIGRALRSSFDISFI
jgi:hypothetical protein